MKKNTMSTIAMAAVALLLSGTFAAAADFGDVSQNDNSATEGRTASASSPQTAGSVIDIDENGQRGPGRRRLYKPRPDPQPEPENKSERFTGICLNTLILGHEFCLDDLSVFLP